MQGNNRWINSRTIGIALFIILLVIGSIWGQRHGSTMDIGLSFSEDHFNFPEADGSFTQVRWSDVTRLELLDKPDFGNAAGGEIRSGVRLGTWSSSQLGEYSACASSRIRSAVLIEAEGKRYVLNVESDSTTRELYETIQGLVNVQ